MSDLSEIDVRKLPKVELHVHLEGTLPAHRLAELAELAGVSLPRPVDELFTFTSFDEFLEFLTWSVGLVRTPDLAAQAAYDFAAFAFESSIIYAEVIVNPTHWEQWSVEPLVEALADGFERAQEDGFADCRLLLSFLRQQSAEDALKLVNFMGKSRPARVVGLSVDGNESSAGRTGPRFAPAYRKARDYGLGLTAHAGETSGPEGVLDAMELLRVDRIDHGVRSVEDPKVLQRVVDAGVALNVCIGSNCVILYPSPQDHPISDLVAAGANVTINTDDPAYLGVDLTDEYRLAASLCGWSEDNLLDTTRRAIDAAFCSAERKTELYSLVGL